MAAAALAEAGGTATAGAGGYKTKLRRLQRRAHVATLRDRLGTEMERSAVLEGQRRHLRDATHAAGGARDAAIIDAHRLHLAACQSLGYSCHSVQEAGWDETGARRVLLRGAVGRHHALGVIDDRVRRAHGGRSQVIATRA